MTVGSVSDSQPTRIGLERFRISYKYHLLSKNDEELGLFLRPSPGLGPNPSPSRSPRKVASQFFARSFRRMSSGSMSNHDRKKKKEVKFPEDPVVRGSNPAEQSRCNLQSSPELRLLLPLYISA